MLRPQTYLALVLLPAMAAAEVENEIPLGVEVVTGVRTDYVYRGFSLGGTTLDAQVETEIVLAEGFRLNLGGWLASELSGDFSEGGGYVELHHDLTRTVTLGAGFSHAARDMSPIGDSSEASLFLQYFPNDFLDLKVQGGRDFETDGWYSAVEGGWSHRVGDDTFILLTSGLSWVDDFHGRSGWNDYFGRLSLTYAVSNAVSVTPYAGWSLLLEDHGGASDSLFAGFWFEVVF